MDFSIFICMLSAKKIEKSEKDPASFAQKSSKDVVLEQNVVPANTVNDQSYTFLPSDQCKKRNLLAQYIHIISDVYLNTAQLIESTDDIFCINTHLIKMDNLTLKQTGKNNNIYFLSNKKGESVYIELSEKAENRMTMTNRQAVYSGKWITTFNDGSKRFSLAQLIPDKDVVSQTSNERGQLPSKTALTSEEEKQNISVGDNHDKTSISTPVVSPNAGDNLDDKADKSEEKKELAILPEGTSETSFEKTDNLGDEEIEPEEKIEAITSPDSINDGDQGVEKSTQNEEDVEYQERIKGTQESLLPAAPPTIFQSLSIHMLMHQVKT